LAAFTMFASDLDEGTRKQLNRGEKMVELLKQGQYAPMPVAKQVMIVWVGTSGQLDDVATDKILDFQDKFFKFCDERFPDIEHTLAKEKVLSDALEAKLKDAVAKFKEQYKA